MHIIYKGYFYSYIFIYFDNHNINKSVEQLIVVVCLFNCASVSCKPCKGFTDFVYCRIDDLSWGLMFLISPEWMRLG